MGPGLRMRIRVPCCVLNREPRSLIVTQRRGRQTRRMPLAWQARLRAWGDAASRRDKSMRDERHVEERRVRTWRIMYANSKYNLAVLHKKRGETEKARQLFLECEQTYSAVYGPDHSETQDAARQASQCA